MDGDEVNRLEEEIEVSIGEALRRFSPSMAVHPLLLHLMAKAAVAVFEAVNDPTLRSEE